MRPPPDSGPGTRPIRSGHGRQLAAGLVVCVALAASATFALDRYLAAKQREEFAGWPADRNRLAAPDLQHWRGAPLPVGSPAPPIQLRDVRTGEPISLEAFRGRQPVVLMLSSFG